MPGQKESIRYHCGYHGAGNHRAHDPGVLLLVDDVVIESEKRGDGAKGEAG